MVLFKFRFSDIGHWEIYENKRTKQGFEERIIYRFFSHGILSQIQNIQNTFYPTIISSLCVS